jgi:uncharacterized protein YaiI (UPF0178 family)
MSEIFVDADACPVKAEIIRVAERHGVVTHFVSNSGFRPHANPLIRNVVVSDKFDAADDWIVGAARPRCVVVTSDILLAGRCLDAGATVIAPTGKAFTRDSIGSAVAVRAIMEDLRAGGEQIGGPAPFSKADRSRFLQTLDTELVRMGRL